MRPSVFQLTRALFLFTIVILVIFGMGSLLRISTNPDRTPLYSFYALAMFADAALLFFCVWQLNKRTKFAFFSSVAVLVLNILPVIFDQFGLVDLLFLLLNLLTLMFLVMARKEFLLV